MTKQPKMPDLRRHFLNMAVYISRLRKGLGLKKKDEKQVDLPTNK